MTQLVFIADIMIGETIHSQLVATFSGSIPEISEDVSIGIIAYLLFIIIDANMLTWVKLPADGANRDLVSRVCGCGDRIKNENVYPRIAINLIKFYRVDSEFT